MAVKLDVNSHLMVVGRCGVHQLVSTFITGFLITACAAQIFASVFTRYSPNFRCDDPGYIELRNDSDIIFDDSCSYSVKVGNVSVTQKCTKFVYNQEIFQETVITKFDLVCDRLYINTIIGMTWMASMGIGAITGSFLSDLIGRKPVIVVCNLAFGILGIMQAFSVNYGMYITTQCLMGAMGGSSFTVASTLMMESISPDYRSHICNVHELFWVFGSTSLSLVAFMLRSWWEVQIFISVPSIVVGLASLWYVDESTHWLTSKGEHQKAIKVLDKMAKMNRTQTNTNFQVEDFELNEKHEEKEHNSMIKQLCQLWFHKRLLIRFMVISVGWISCSLCYYALSLGVSSLAGDIFVNNFIMCIVEGFAYICCMAVACLGRKWPTVACFLSGGICLLISLLLVIFLPEASTIISALKIAGKFCVSAAWQCIIIWSNELYPTTLRCTLAATNSVVGKIGSVLGPLVIDLPSLIDVPHEEVIVPSLFVVLMLGAGALHIIPPETNKCKLPESMQEANVKRFTKVDNSKLEELNDIKSAIDESAKDI